MVRADNAYDSRIEPREFPTLEDVPQGVGFNRVVEPDTGRSWIRGSFPDQPAQWFKQT